MPKDGAWITAKEACKAYGITTRRLKYLIDSGQLTTNKKNYADKRIRYIAGKTFEYQRLREKEPVQATHSNTQSTADYEEPQLDISQKHRIIKMKLDLQKLEMGKAFIRKEYEDELFALLYDKLNKQFKPLLESLKLTPEQVEILNAGWKKLCPVD